MQKSYDSDAQGEQQCSLKEFERRNQPQALGT
jgi:hypothetical protein